MLEQLQFVMCIKRYQDTHPWVFGLGLGLECPGRYMIGCMRLGVSVLELC